MQINGDPNKIPPKSYESLGQSSVSNYEQSVQEIENRYKDGIDYISNIFGDMSQGMSSALTRFINSFDMHAVPEHYGIVDLLGTFMNSMVGMKNPSNPELQINSIRDSINALQECLNQAHLPGNNFAELEFQHAGNNIIEIARQVFTPQRQTIDPNGNPTVNQDALQIRETVSDEEIALLAQIDEIEEIENAGQANADQDSIELDINHESDQQVIDEIVEDANQQGVNINWHIENLG